MRNEYLNKVEDNASVCTWSEKTQLEKGDSAKQLFYQDYGDLPYLLDVKVDRHLFRAMGYKAYVRPASLLTFTKKLVIITGMSEQWAVAHVKKRVDVLALSIYSMVIFPKALGHIDEAVADLFDQLSKQNTPMPTILAEMIRSLNACRRVGEGRFIGCAQLLLIWFHSHFWKLDKVPCRVFFEGYSPLKEAVDRPRRDDISEERWIDILQNLREEDVIWKAPWLVLSEVLYRCGSFDWGLVQCDFSYKGDHYKKRMREISEAWKKPFCMKILTEGSTSTLEYKGWFSRRINDNVPRPILGVARSLEESLRVIPSEVEIMKQEFERKNSELEMRMEKLIEEKMCLSLDVDVQNMEVEKGRIREIFRAMATRDSRGKSKSQVLEEEVPRDAVARNSAIELKASLDKIEEMRHNIGGLEVALQDCELRIEQLETREEQWNEELHHLWDQVRDSGHVMEEALVQIREVAEHLQELAIQARTLSIMYESSLDKGRELALLLDRVKTLGLRAKVYL
ncbi:hypothetical protein CXB51_002635 [Gossypium anomalum]|uniref:DUF7745 domain-containing protein n=1 Tax=Gossypium anomalum TaxID=47600 RepID=A0A8J6DA11_9ROSI|nr:hypothetical protein CXB51_002635 [Gossypium anomalum]